MTLSRTKLLDELERHSSFEPKYSPCDHKHFVQCSCGARIPNLPGALVQHRADAIVALFAPELSRLREQRDEARKQLAEAWFHGVDAALDAKNYRTQIVNPYLGKGEDA